MENDKITDAMKEKYGEITSSIILVQNKEGTFSLITYGDHLTQIGMMDLARKEIIESFQAAIKNLKKDE
jgi:hypothetical protein